MFDRHVMLLPSQACQASCAYCFGPNRGPTMSFDVLGATLDWLEATNEPGQKLELTFHGGEPLLAGEAWYRYALPVLRERFGSYLKLCIQSNLWLLDDKFCNLFKEYEVSIGTSIDGPQNINDQQRGIGHFTRTMAGIEIARRNGLSVGAICTFTANSALRYKDVLEFFSGNGLGFSVHEAVRVLGNNGCDGFTLSSEQHTELFKALFDDYLANPGRIRISTFDSMARGVSAGEGCICTFRDCLGRYLSINPEGGIFPCNRFTPHPEWRMGFVQECPTLEALVQTAPWQRLCKLEQDAHKDCGSCPHFHYCKGGCRYNAIAAGTRGRDPHCSTYRLLFAHIIDKALKEVFSEENMRSVIEKGTVEKGFLHKGPLLQIMRNGPHPQEVLRRSREIVAAVGLAVSDSPEEALRKLDSAGVITCPEIALQSIKSLHRRLKNSGHDLLNAYLHITYSCNLKCTHCYASSGSDRTDHVMTVDQIRRLVKQMDAAGFEKVVITGGEPLVHPQHADVLDSLTDCCRANKKSKIVLRSNLALSISPETMYRISRCANQIVVSIDGDETSHNARRGFGAYELTLANLRNLLFARPSAEVILAATLQTDQIIGKQGDTVRVLGKELGIKVRFKPILPLGRAAKMPLALEFDSSLFDSVDNLANSSGPLTTCGLGMNMYIEPNGDCYPCYALMNKMHYLGNIFKDGMETVLKKDSAFRQVTVDSNQQCCSCSLRYLCGGFCRAWCSGSDPNSPPNDCTGLKQRARKLLLGALESLEISSKQWESSVFVM